MPRGDRLPIVVDIVSAPDGLPAVLLQLPDAYLLMTNPGQVVELGRTLIDYAAKLP